MTSVAKSWQRRPKEDVVVPFEESQLAMQNYYNLRMSGHAPLSFSDYLGLPYWSFPPKKYTKQAAEKIRMLNSPHYRALYMARRARNRKNAKNKR